MDELARLNKSLEANTAELVALKQALLTKDTRSIAELERLLSESRRSGKGQAAPFSKGQPSEEPAKPGHRSGKAHGRHGHRMTPASVDHEVDVPLVSCCPDCGGDVEIEPVADQYETDLPAMRPVTTRFRVPGGRCRRCGKRVQGRHQDRTSDALGAAGAQVGPNAKAWAAWLHYGLGLSFVKSARLLARLGIDVSAGALCQSAQSLSTGLMPVQAAIVERVNSSKVIVLDETGWRVGGEGAWLWAVDTPDLSCYWVAEGRGFEEATIVISPEFDGVIVRDGWAPYRKFDKATHQSCLAHLLRRCHEMMEDLPTVPRHVPRRVRDILIEALDARELPPEEIAAVVVDLKERVEMLHWVEMEKPSSPSPCSA